MTCNACQAHPCMCAEIADKSIREITDPALQRAAVAFVRAVLFIDSAQWPLSSHEGHRTGKPGSRPPGRAPFASQRARLVRAGEDAEKTRAYVVNALAKVRGTVLVESVGGVQILCGYCHRPMEYGKRADARYCSEACKSKAARERRAS